MAHCRVYPLGKFSEHWCPPSNSNKPSNIHKETRKMLHRKLIVPVKVNQLPSYRRSKNIFEWIIQSRNKLHLSFFCIRFLIKNFAVTTLPSVHYQDLKLLTERYACFSDLYTKSVNKIRIFFFNFDKTLGNIVPESLIANMNFLLITRVERITKSFI